MPFLQGQYGNASSRHDLGIHARQAIEQAREQVASLVHVHPAQVIFTSGGTEANNLLIKGAAEWLKPSQVVISAIEHPCVVKPAQFLARRGWQVRQLAVSELGVVDTEDLEQALSTPTGIVSVMMANNETGCLQPVGVIAQKARAAKALMHSDAVQALGKIEIDFEALQLHAMTISAHKIYGPKGAGALIVDRRIELFPLLSGGGHENGLRSGTENVPAIVGFGVAAELAASRLANLKPRLSELRDKFESALVAMGAIRFGSAVDRLCNTSYFAFDGVDGETLVIELDKLGFGLASGAACSSAYTEPSATLLAMGVAPEIARGAVRFSLGVHSTKEHINVFLTALKSVVNRLKSLAAMTASEQG